MIVLLLLPAGCEESAEKIPEAGSQPSLIYVNTLSGGGDIGYTDQIIDGLMRFYRTHEISLSLRNPADMDEVAAMIQDWYETGAENNKSVLVLGDDAYEACLNKLDMELSDSRSIIIVNGQPKDNRRKGVYSFYIARYGVSCLAGLMAGESGSAHIIAACQNVASVDESAEGFMAGYKRASGNEASVYCLDSGYKGFAMPDKAFDTARDLDDGFIYPLAGGSNNGVFRYTRENPFTPMLVAGMDIDCSALSTRVPFSVIIPISDVMESVLEDWYEDQSGCRDRVFHFGEEFGAKIEINASFLNNAWIWENYYDSPDYWSNRMEKYSEDAKLMEKNYYER